MKNNNIFGLCLSTNPISIGVKAAMTKTDETGSNGKLTRNAVNNSLSHNHSHAGLKTRHMTTFPTSNTTAKKEKSGTKARLSATLDSIKDEKLRELFCLDVPFFKLLKRYTTDNFLQLDPSRAIPFFAEIRNYQGAKEECGDVWIVRPIKGEEIIQTATSTIVYFLDRFTGSLSAPTILTKINNQLYRATKLITKADQLSGANYTVEKHLKEQLALDLINRWIFADEDRNPNNYLVKTDSKNLQLIIPIDFCNADLTSEVIKIKGVSSKFGWARKEKTQYLTPLKMNTFTEYDMAFYQHRFQHFEKIDAKLLKRICKAILRLCPQSVEIDKMTGTITRNILRRIHYVHAYFEKHIPDHIVKTNKYSGMGEAFLKISQGDL